MEAVFPLFFCRIIIVFRGMDEVQLDKVEGEGSSERQGRQRKRRRRAEVNAEPPQSPRLQVARNSKEILRELPPFFSL